MSLEVTDAIAEENRQLRDLLVQEFGGVQHPCFHDPTRRVDTDRLWERKQQEALGTQSSSNIPSSETGAHLLLRSTAQMQGSTLLQCAHSEPRHDLPAPRSGSLFEVTEMPVSPATSSHIHVEYSQSTLSHVCHTTPKKGESACKFQASTRSPSACIQANCKEIENNPVTCTSTRTANPEPVPEEDDLARRKQRTGHVSVQRPQNRPRFSGVCAAERDFGDQSLPNTTPKPSRTLPPEVTTLMVRHIPARLSPAELVELWPPEDTYNLLYVPFSFKRNRRGGVAFINMVSHEAAV